MIIYDIEKLKSLNDNEICSIPYPDEYIKQWKTGDISFLLKSQSPKFIKDILEHKKREYIIENNKKRINKNYKSSRYFGEGYVASILGDCIQKGWYSSFKWLYKPGWITGKIVQREKNPIMAKLKNEFYTKALKEYIDFTKLKKLQRLWKSEEPKAPDLWLIDKKGHQYFIEVKKESDGPDEENKQMLGLALLEKYFNVSIFIVYLHSESKDALKNKKQEKWLKVYKSIKKNI